MRIQHFGAAGALANTEHIRVSVTTKALPTVLVLFSGQLGMAQATGSIRGNVTNSSSAPVFAAVVVAEGGDGSRHTTVTDAESVFRISALTAGNYDVKISASGFGDWTASNVPVSESPQSKSLLAILQVATEVTTVTVSPPAEEVAAEQLRQEVKQRTLGVIPNYYVTYESHPAPLSSPQNCTWR
jgi:hypothetical protein